MTKPPTVTMPITEFASMVFTDMAHDVIDALRRTDEGVDKHSVEMVFDTAYDGELGYAMKFLYSLVADHPAVANGALLWWMVDMLEWLWQVLTGEPLPENRIDRYDDREGKGVIKNPPYYHTRCMEINPEF